VAAGDDGCDRENLQCELSGHAVVKPQRSGCQELGVEKPRSGTASCRLDRRLRSRQSSLHISSSSPVARSTTSLGDGGASACLSGRRGLRSFSGRSVDSVRLTAAVETWSVGHRASKVLLRGSPFTTGEGRSLGWSVCHFDGSLRVE
jgi:hypothetical protein